MTTNPSTKPSFQRKTKRSIPKESKINRETETRGLSPKKAVIKRSEKDRESKRKNLKRPRKRNRSEEEWCRSARSARNVAETGQDSKCHPLATKTRKNKRKIP
ncbi:hypothetical protein CDAR_525821 [Caerostris darwini]|uniref:Uncharacterized protein n=1 Tax=Caerostris darwini TaxID=1538125 RepID=A0AAV4SU33_9ARAC|nr:hypothetical protein CDAR_525821 [Caerostris darwini]